MNIIIGKAKKSYLNDICDLIYNYFKEAPNLIEIDDKELRENILYFIDNENANIFLAYDLENNKALGLLMCSISNGEFWHKEAIAYDQCLYVLPEFRRLKISTALVDMYKKWAKSKLAKRIYLRQMSGLNINNFKKFSKNNGFTFCGNVLYIED